MLRVTNEALGSVLSCDFKEKAFQVVKGLLGDVMISVEVMGRPVVLRLLRMDGKDFCFSAVARLETCCHLQPI